MVNEQGYQDIMDVVRRALGFEVSGPNVQFLELDQNGALQPRSGNYSCVRPATDQEMALWRQISGLSRECLDLRDENIGLIERLDMLREQAIRDSAKEAGSRAAARKAK